ncbi:MAG: hypothetical protein JO168_17270 [Solirubrobacterales bacterium]|nr:hypothetical protein [Solirubrobacterales bacterium]MBV9715057.1 hypothetical protein [Solirubrobacterales bacterium]
MKDRIADQRGEDSARGQVGPQRKRGLARRPDAPPGGDQNAGEHAATPALPEDPAATPARREDPASTHAPPETPPRRQSRLIVGTELTTPVAPSAAANRPAVNRQRCAGGTAHDPDRPRPRSRAVGQAARRPAASRLATASRRTLVLLATAVALLILLVLALSGLSVV